ncbi:MAG: glycosyltransferase [Planctomycetales bacterium]|nr:glycosyltransferase [Planctomycetales bacterium]
MTPAGLPGVSVALCTLDGARFLPGQLGSVRAQTLAPVEVVVRDDGSRDGTPAILREFAATVPFPVRFLPAGERLGPAQGFARALAECRGELVAFCDQDDVWDARKLERLARALGADPGAGAAFSDGTVVDEAGGPRGDSLWGAVGFGPRARARLAGGRAFEVLMRHPVVTGATLAVRASLRPLLLPVPPGWMHDEWFALAAASVSRLAPVPEPLVRYRVHAAQRVGIPAPGLRARLDRLRERRAEERRDPGGGRRAEAEAFERLAERLAEGSRPAGYALQPGVAEALDGRLRHLRRRAAFPRSRFARLPGILREAAGLHYWRFANGWRSLARDLLA